MNKYKIRPYLAAALALIMVLCLLLVTGCSEESDSTEPAEVPEVAANPLTGQTVDEGFDENALNQRTVAFVVENASEARPQWGMDDPQYSPDIVLQGEVEAGITRTLWFYADYNKLPEVIGPMRSARPPYIKFSELFDSIFIHWGQSSSKGNYVGAKTVFKKDKVDHINQMTFNDTMGLYGRDQSRSVAIEHRGTLNGSKVPEAIAQEGFRTEPKDYTRLNFNTLSWLTSFEPADTVRVNYSDRASWEKTFWTYNPEDKKYHTASFNNDFARDNLIILYDETEYIDKSNYQGQAGHTVSYCNYALGGGKGYLCSQGSVKEIEWGVQDGKLVLVDVEATLAARERAAQAAAEAAENEDSGEEAEAEAEEAESILIDAGLYPGKTWIGWISSNNGGNVEIEGSLGE